LGPEGVLTGSARLSQEAKEKATAVQRSLEIESKRGELARRQQALEAQIAVLQLQFQTDKEEMERDIASEQAYLEKLEQSRHEMARSRKADSNGLPAPTKKGRK
jgi:circadian clock protein KaiC